MTARPIQQTGPTHRRTQAAGPAGHRRLPRLAVVAVSYNSADQLPGMLDSLVQGLEGLDGCEVIIADNASADNSIAVARAHALSPTIVAMGRNAGYSAGINAAADIIAPDTDMLILNPDVRLLPGAARRLQERLQLPEVGAAVPRILHTDGTLALSLRREPSLLTVWSDAIVGSSLAARLGVGEIVGDTREYETGGAVEWATGAAIAVAARARSRVGRWDETFFLYSEEVDFMRRVRDDGLRVEMVPESQAIHIGGEYHRNRRLSYLMTANRIRYYRRYNGALPATLFRLAVLCGSAARCVLGPGHRAAFAAALRRWQAPPESRPIAGVTPVVMARKPAE